MSNRRSGLRTKAAQSVAVSETPQAPPGSSDQYLSALGVYGFGAIEPVILAALVTEDPLLLIGASGTGKTYLLNSLSEALDLEHRHYNASLISFDDLVGFPYPDPDGDWRQVSRDAGDGVERAIRADRRDQPQQAGAAEPAVLACPRAQGAGHRPAEAALPLGGDEPLLVGPGQRGELHRLGAARPGAGRPLRPFRPCARLGGSER